MTPLFFASEGFGLNLNLFETNILKLAVVIFGLYKFLPGFLGKILEKRRTTILTDLKDAEERLSQAKNSLSKAKDELGWQADIDLDSLISEIWNEYKSRSNA